MTSIGFEPLRLIVGFIFAVALSTFSCRIKALSVSGSVTALVIGTMVFGLGGWLYAIPLLYFFITSSLLSKLKSDIKSQSLKTINKPGPRDYRQVLANGGIAACCLLAGVITGSQIWIYLYLASLAASAADTWATEIGTLLSAKPISIITFKHVPPGQSGGISFPGTSASFFGAATTAFSIYPITTSNINLPFMLAATASGFIGSIADSFLGATVQASYRCNICGVDTEKATHCGNKSKLIKGYRIIDNDMVNLISNIIAVSSIMLFIK